jgi:DNA modification methylase
MPRCGKSELPQWPADQVERRPVASLIPAARNARTHSPAQIEQLVASLREWGWTNPVLVDEGGRIIAGHGRVLAAQALGWPEVPVMVATGWTEAQKRAYLIADNQLALVAGWDEELLAVELDELRDLKFDLPLLGFSQAELNALIGTPNTGYDPDEVPPVPADPVSLVGDLWVIGSHRVLCGDATSAADVARLLVGNRPVLMVTDPPYGVDYDPDWRNRASRDGSLTHTIGATAIGRVTSDDRADWFDAWRLFTGNAAYVWHASGFGSLVQESLAKTGLLFRSQIIWNKDRMIIGRGDYHWKHEACFYVVRKGKTGNYQGDRTQTTVWDISHRSSETGLSTQKPVECMRRPIENNSNSGQAVYDPFLGSGTTVIAAEQTGRACYGMEINPVWVDVSVRRWEIFTGGIATLEATGQTFEDVKRERQKAEAGGADEREGALAGAEVDERAAAGYLA